MPDLSPLPGVRPGQIWDEVQPKRRAKAHRWTVFAVDHMFVVLRRGTVPDVVARQTFRDGFEQRYRLVSEPAPMDVGYLSLPAEVQQETERGEQ